MALLPIRFWGTAKASAVVVFTVASLIMLRQTQFGVPGELFSATTPAMTSQSLAGHHSARDSAGSGAKFAPGVLHATFQTVNTTSYERYKYRVPTARWEGPSAECGEGPMFDKFFNQSEMKRSRAREDKILYEAFFRKRGAAFKGKYVELGAFDGVKASNSRFFDLCLGWEGLLIEGHPVSFQRLVQNRPAAHRMNFAPSCSAEMAATNGTVRFSARDFTSAGLSEFVKARNEVLVPCGPLGPVLHHIFQGGTIDFFSLDVEGAELLVLDTVEFHAVRIDVLMVESWNRLCTSQCAKRDAVRTKMKALGYRLMKTGFVPLSDLFVHSEFRHDFAASVIAARGS